MRRAVTWTAMLLCCVSCVSCASCGAGRGKEIADARDGACGERLVRVSGACIGEDDARAFCGGPFVRGACASWPACDEGEAIDARTAECVPSLGTRAIATRDSIVLAETGAAGCHEDHTLVATGGHLACLLASSLAPRDAAALAPTIQRDQDGTTVDVSLWARAALGPSGGPGSPLLCGAIARDPGGAGVRPGASTALAIAIELDFPNNDVGAATARVQGPAADAVSTLLPSLRALGGRASAAAVSVRVSCAVSGGTPPLALTKKKH